jgi:hypothetical protein
MMSPLETLRPGSLRSTFPSLRRLLAVGAWGWAVVAGAEMVGGVQLPDGAAKVGENRYRAPKDFEETLKYYRLVYPPATYPRKTIINQPGVKAVHIAFPPGKGVDGLNIYEDKESLREVRIYVVPAEAKADAKNGVDKRRGKK